MIKRKNQKGVKEMGNKKAVLLLTSLLFISLIICCSDDGGSTGPEETGPEWQAETITIPDKMEESADPMVQNAVAYLNLANAIGNYTAFLTPPDKSNSFENDFYSKEDSSWTYNWSNQELDITLLVTKVGDIYEWTVILNGTDGEYNYDNWTFIEAETQNDNNTGNMVVYQPVTTTVLMEFYWNTDNQDVYHITYETYGAEQVKIEIHQYPDGSGEVKFYQFDDADYVMRYKATWNPDGSGQWWTYNENGLLVDTGSWS